MKLHELLGKYTDDEILNAFYALYPDQEENLPGYTHALMELRSLAPTTPTWRILVEEIKAEDDDLSDEDWVNISGVKDDDPITYAIEYEPFEEWLGAEIDARSFEGFDPLDVAAHCLFEMTWTGYSNTERKSAFNAVMDIYDDAVERMDEIKGADWREMLN